ncbi:MAG: 50S ribosomal protein L24 [Candidatus Yonathbacteria bacterium RIFOXYC1_FULL_52_10]|uniref:Large ribosomal subunit protein uL24 n=1 Tax=Candidatus Yonathbacteria bacterium RIFOXYD1_FULL_52_36 TaxID=1802730 RepID=A0A1G2SIG6_9BACT|nr:MAG: 50S ribosomal protein L24 [Candidatus Yonathbacteria bacterium RIFOXYC1_FULL_52_10]OHA84873.1 MAG: 50S ribosomal protein L24 [Candidatus Yonathbacteria bacterium RIFOXYD1_FULL_52_36]
MNIKKGDTVVIIAGKEKGKKGKVAEAMPRESRVVVEGMNMRKRHVKARRAGTKGQTVEFAAPMHVSNVMIADPKTGKPSRIGKKVVGEKRVRIAKKSGTEI